MEGGTESSLETFLFVHWEFILTKQGFLVRQLESFLPRIQKEL